MAKASASGEAPCGYDRTAGSAGGDARGRWHRRRPISRVPSPPKGRCARQRNCRAREARPPCRRSSRASGRKARPRATARAQAKCMKPADSASDAGIHSGSSVHGVTPWRSSVSSSIHCATVGLPAARALASEDVDETSHRPHARRTRRRRTCLPLRLSTMSSIHDARSRASMNWTERSGGAGTTAASPRSPSKLRGTRSARPNTRSDRSDRTVRR